MAHSHSIGYYRNIFCLEFISDTYTFVHIKWEKIYIYYSGTFVLQPYISFIPILQFERATPGYYNFVSPHTETMDKAKAM